MTHKVILYGNQLRVTWRLHLCKIYVSHIFLYMDSCSYTWIHQNFKIGLWDNFLLCGNSEGKVKQKEMRSGGNIFYLVSFFKKILLLLYYSCPIFPLFPPPPSPTQTPLPHNHHTVVRVPWVICHLYTFFD